MLAPPPGNSVNYACPCSGGTNAAPAFIGDNWFCSSGHHDCSGDSCWSAQWYEDELFNTNREDSTGISISASNASCVPTEPREAAPERGSGNGGC